MYFCRSFVFAALPFLTLAIPLAPSPAPGGISIPIAKHDGALSADPLKFAQSQRANTIAQIERGIHVYKQNTGLDYPFHGDIKTSSKRDGTGNVPLTDSNNELWYGAIEVGTPPVTFEVLFDTGSSDLVLPASDCTSNCAGHTEYDPSASSSSHDLGEPFKLSYGGFGGASVEGEQYTDDVTIGGQTARSQTLGAATQYSSQWSTNNFPPDGLMGMAFQSISGFNARPTFQTLIAQGEEAQPVFSFKLAPDGSELFLGGANPDLYKGNFTWVNLTTQGYWQAPFDSILVDGVPVVGKREAVYDTGTTLIIGDPAGIKRLYSLILGSLPAPPDYGEGFYTIPCNLVTPIVITVGGKAVEISPESFNLGAVPEAGPDRCLGGASWITDLPNNFWVLGDVFLRNIYTSWDVGQARIGFADLS